MTDLDRTLVDVVAREVEARRDDAVRLLQELVRVPSTTGDEGAVQEKVEHAFRGRALEVDVWEAEAREVEPYRDHVGDQEAYENRPNVAGAAGGAADGRCFSTPTSTPSRRASSRPGATTRSGARSSATGSTAGAPAT